MVFRFRTCSDKSKRSWITLNTTHLISQNHGFQFEFFVVFLIHVFLTLCVKCRPLFSGVHFLGARPVYLRPLISLV